MIVVDGFALQIAHKLPSSHPYCYALVVTAKFCHYYNKYSCTSHLQHYCVVLHHYIILHRYIIIIIMLPLVTTKTLITTKSNKLH